MSPRSPSRTSSSSSKEAPSRNPSAVTRCSSGSASLTCGIVVRSCNAAATETSLDAYAPACAPCAAAHMSPYMSASKRSASASSSSLRTSGATSAVSVATSPSPRHSQLAACRNRSTACRCSRTETSSSESASTWPWSSPTICARHVWNSSSENAACCSPFTNVASRAKTVSESDDPTRPSTALPSSAKNSKLRHQSKMKNRSLSAWRPSSGSFTASPSHSLVPRPIICQNLILDRTFLKKTRFTISGTSMPVSIMSTETVITGRGLSSNSSITV